MKTIAGKDYVVIDTPARPNSDDLKELAKGCDLLILPHIIWRSSQLQFAAVGLNLLQVDITSVWDSFSSSLGISPDSGPRRLVGRLSQSGQL